jgi:hypothetical protein
LVLNVLCGLNERFQVVSQLIPRQRPFPSFADVRADLRLAELNMAPSSTPPPSDLVATSTTKTPPPPTPVGPGSPRPPPAHGSAPGGGRGRCRRGGRGHGGSSGGSNGGPQWPSIYNPWTGSIHLWPGGPRGQSPRPGPTPPPHALMDSMPPTFYQAPPPVPGFTQALPSAPSPWHPHSLTNTFSTVSLTPPPSSSD